MDNAVIITGSSGAIGSAIVNQFKKNNFFVIGLDQCMPTDVTPDVFINIDLGLFTSNSEYRENKYIEISACVSDKSLELLINNAASQILDTGTYSDLDSFLTMQSINALAPLALYIAFKDSLVNAQGSMINIGSIHSTLTKLGFTGYAASKASLRSITKSLAIESMGDVRVFSVEPAAIDTPMLRASFQAESKLKDLKSFHPVGDIGTPEELAELVYLLFSSGSAFLHGSCIDFSGGIAGRLHDPD